MNIPCSAHLAFDPGCRECKRISFATATVLGQRGLLGNIFSNLNTNDLKSASQVSKRWNATARPRLTRMKRMQKSLKCSNPGCIRLVEPPNLTCSYCQQETPLGSSMPLFQARSDILRSKPEFYRGGSVPLELPSKKRKELDSGQEPLFKSFDDFSKKKMFERPCNGEQSLTKIPILFIPFEGNFNSGNMGGYLKHGNQLSSLYETRDQAPFLELGSTRIDKIDLPSTVGSSKYWSGRNGETITPTQLTQKKGSLKDLFQNKTQQDDKQMVIESGRNPFYDMVVEDRFKYLNINKFTSSDQGLPEVIILSERLLDWPDVLVVVGRRYKRCFTLGTKSNLQDMAAYVLDSAVRCYRFEVLKRSSKHKKSFTETWLVVRKITVIPAFSVACVHLSSDYTSCDTTQMAPIMEKVLKFARSFGIHAIVGDCNLNTYGLHGGFFPVFSDFVDKNGSFSLKTTVATSNGGGDKAYMGGLICDSRVSFRSTLTTFGNCAVPPWFDKKHPKFPEALFSDHHSIYCNYALYTSQSGFLFTSPSNQSSAGDCFFDTLRNRLRLTQSAKDLREYIINKIKVSVIQDNIILAPRSVLVHIADTDSAVPIQCNTLEHFMEEMGKPGRWVDDTIIPYIAQFLGKKIIVQCGDFYAIFNTDGSRQDRVGFAPMSLWSEVIHMNCLGNHFW